MSQCIESPDGEYDMDQQITMAAIDKTAELDQEQKKADSGK
ncbi:hypothetical protein [Thalassomonas actiniarum]|nr:hypothetical protein [Thalassomonas actiniarum]